MIALQQFAFRKNELEKSQEENLLWTYNNLINAVRTRADDLLLAQDEILEAEGISREELMEYIESSIGEHGKTIDFALAKVQLIMHRFRGNTLH